MTAKADSAPLSFTEKLGYGLGDMASNFYLGFFSLYLLYYYTDVYGLAPGLVGLMLLIAKITDALSDPIMGIISDRTESRWGKYRPYLLWGAVPYGLLGIAIFFGPNFSDTGKLIYAYVTYIGVMVAFTVMNVPYSALLAVISPVAEERTKATTFRFVFAAGGSLFVAMLATPLVKLFGGGDDVVGFRLTMLLFAVGSIALFWFTFATTKERIQLPRHSSSGMNDIKILLKNVSWVVLAIACIVILLALVARFASIIYYVKYYMQDDGKTVFLFLDRVAFFTSLGLVGQILGSMITSRLTSLFSKHYLVLYSCLLHTVLLVISYFIPADMYGLAVALHFLGMLTFGVVITVLFAMFTDCAEYGEWLTGQRSSGLTVSASMFALKFGSALGGAIPAFILGFIGFVANETPSEYVRHGIQAMATLLPAILFAIGGALMLFYKIDKDLLVRIEAELIKRREELPVEPLAG